MSVTVPGSSTLVSTPTITNSVVQSFFIESLTGASPPETYLDRFPDSIYSKAFDSLLVQFLYALLGPVGVGLLRQEYLEARLLVEGAGLQTTDIDSLYSNAFGFARLAEETYQIDANASLLSATDQSAILQQDAAFRNRAMDFLKGARGGTTKRGLTLVAKSGLSRPVELMENYLPLFDHYSDVQLYLPSFGLTNSVSEVTVVPRQVSPESSVQALTISGDPTQGWFTLTYPAGQEWTAIPVSTTSGSATITIPNAVQFPSGVFVTLTNLSTTSTAAQIDPTQPYWNHATLYAESAGGSSTTATLVQPLSGVSPGAPATAPATGNFIAFVGMGQTYPLPFNASSAQVQNALTNLPLIGLGNVVCTGGPLPNQPITIQFTNQLSDQPLPNISANVDPDEAVGITAVTVGTVQEMSDILFNPLDIYASVATTQTGVSSASQQTVIAPADEYALYAALNQTRPVTSLFTVQQGTPETVQQTVNASFQGSSQTNVIRYATGRNIQWPDTDATHWIEAGIEHEAPKAYGTDTRYSGFHNISVISSYTEQAIVDLTYLFTTTLGNIYWDSLIGNYSQNQLALYPGLGAFSSVQGGQQQFLPTNAPAPQPEPLIISTLDDGTGVINEIYPVDYVGVPGVTQTTGGLLWASAERASGIDYLEVDLGSVQPINWLYFEATNKPYLISASYDTLDQSPQRNFIPITLAPLVGPCITSLNYEATVIWTPVTINCTNTLGNIIYSRYIRLEFTKVPVGTVYGPIGKAPIPYSIEVQNLRVGRLTY